MDTRKILMRQSCTIEIIDDLIQEPEEVFLVYLEIVQINIEDLRNLELTRNNTVGRIRIDNDRECIKSQPHCAGCFNLSRVASESVTIV